MSLSPIKIYPASATHEWEPIQKFSKPQGKRHDPDSISASVHFTQNKSGDVTKSLRLSLGTNITDEINLQENERINVFFEKKNPVLIRLIPTASNNGYKVKKYTNGHCFFIGFTFPSCLGVELKRKSGIKVNFQIYTDRSIEVHLSKLL